MKNDKLTKNMGDRLEHEDLEKVSGGLSQGSMPDQTQSCLMGKQELDVPNAPTATLLGKCYTGAPDAIESEMFNGVDPQVKGCGCH